MCWLQVCVVLLLVTPLARSAENSTSDNPDGRAGAGSGEGDRPDNILSLKLGMWMAVVAGTVVIVVLVFICVLSAVCTFKRQRQRSSPTYLGSCRRINTIHRNVNIGVEAMERPRVPPLQYHHNSRENHHRMQCEGENHLMAQTITLAPGVVAVRLGPRYEGRVAGHRGRGGGQESTCQSYYELTPVSSLTRTYTYPNLHTERRCSHRDHEVHSEHPMVAAISAPCLPTSPSEPLQMQEHRESVCRLSLAADHSTVYMKLDIRTMDGTSDYEILTKTKPATTTRAGLQGSVVATNLAHGRRKRPPPLIAGRHKMEHTAVRELQSVSSIDRGSAEEMGHGTSRELLLQHTAS